MMMMMMMIIIIIIIIIDCLLQAITPIRRKGINRFRLKRWFNLPKDVMLRVKLSSF